jgi:two-component sensor histidine kinase/ligand-binding sensor protein/DNA-binding response OmpR family regulator
MSKTEPKTLLLVEDEVIIALSEKMQLEQAGYRVVHAASGEAAVENLHSRNDTIDLILIDIDLGKGIDGIETAQEIIKDHDIPLLFLSSHTEKEIVQKTEQITNYGYVVKNSSITVLDASIKMAFKLFEAQKNIQLQKMEIEAAYEEMQVSNEVLQETQNSLISSESAVRNKLNAILEPEGDIGTLELSDIIDTHALQSLMEDFYDLTGILGAILDIRGNILVAAGWQDICTKFHRCNPITAQHCKESDTILTKGVSEGTFKVYRCKNNMWDMVTPLVLDNNHIGNIFIGQFIYEDEKIDTHIFQNQAKKYGFDEEAYLAALNKVPRFSREKVNKGMAFYSKIAKMISSLSYSSIKLSRTITEKEIAEKKIKTLLAEKELILKEVHHRIQNNMSTIKSLLSIQSDAQRDIQVKNLFKDAISRVESVRTLYDKLYRSGNFQNVSMKDYLSSLVEEIVNIFPQEYDLTIRSEIDDISLNTKLISNIGIIINELTTNTMKYAFAGRTNGTISLKVSKQEDAIRLTYADDGIGMPESVTFETSTGFGIQIIKMLVEQIDGSLRIERGAGTKYVIEFDGKD